MKIAKAAFKAMTRYVLSKYHRQMAKWFRQAAARHADFVIHTQHRVPTASLKTLRGKAELHTQKANAIRIGE